MPVVSYRLSDEQAAPIFYRNATVEELTGLPYLKRLRWAKRGLFPKSIRIGPNTTAWVADEIHKWIDERIASRDGA